MFDGNSTTYCTHIFFAGVFKSGRPLRVKSASMQERNLLADSTFDKLQFNIVWEMSRWQPLDSDQKVM